MKLYKQIQILPNGLTFYKTDLHIHCPIKIKNETENYADNVTIQNIIDKLIEKEYDLVSLGHHNSIKAISQIMNYIKENHSSQLKKITVLPSIEINMNENFHLLIIFPEKLSEKRINEILIKFGFKSPENDDYDEDQTINYFENTKSVPEMNMWEILKYCKEEGLIVIAPHICDRSKGFEENLVDRDRTKAIKKDLLLILDCKTLPDFYKVSNKNLENKIAHIHCSDSHCLNDLGSTATWIKMHEPRYKSLQQIIYEPKLRVSDEEPKSKTDLLSLG